MSVAATSWVWRQGPDIAGNDRLVLLAIADAADTDGANAWPSIDTLADMAGISTRTVRRCIQHLVELGALGYEKNAGGPEGSRGDRRPNRYTVRMVERGDSLTSRSDSDGVTTLSPGLVDNRSERGDSLTSRSDHGVTNPASRGDSPGIHGVTLLSYERPLTKPEQFGPTDAGHVDNASLRSAILQACGIVEAELTESGLGPVLKARSEILASGGTPDEVARRARCYRNRFPGMALTPSALAKHWGSLGAPAITTESQSPARQFGDRLALIEHDHDGALQEIRDNFEDDPRREDAFEAWKARREELAHA
jgi:hypothetical protein